MSGIEKLTGGSILVLAFCLTFFVGQNLFIEDAHSQISSVRSSSGTNNSRAQEFENTLRALHSENSTERHQAVISLGKSANPAAVPPLIEALKDSDYFVRSFAAVALGNLKAPQALDPLIKALSDAHPRVRRSAAEALGSIRNPDAFEPLLKAMSDDDVFVKRSAAQALGLIGDPRAVAPLLKALGSTDSYIATGASVALTTLGNAAVSGLVGALGDWKLGPRIVEVLKGLNWKPATDEETVRFEVASRNWEALRRDWETVKKMLLADLKSEETPRSENAVYALIGIGKEDALEPLASILRSKGTPEMAQAFLDSGNAKLSEIARQWAKEHGMEIRASENAAVVKWGGRTS
jgi:HEAT repeat protein